MCCGLGSSCRESIWWLGHVLRLEYLGVALILEDAAGRSDKGAHLSVQEGAQTGIYGISANVDFWDIS